MRPFLLLAGAAVLSTGYAAVDRVPLRLSTAAHSAEVRMLPDGGCEVRTTGGDPYVLCERVETDFDPRRLSVFAFEFKCPEALEFFEVFFGNPFAPHNRYGSGPLPPAPEWTRFAVDLICKKASLKPCQRHRFNAAFTDRHGQE